MNKWLRAWGAICTIALLIWLPFEDTETWMAIALAAAACLWLFLRWNLAPGRHRRVGERKRKGQFSTDVSIYLARGFLLGAAAPILAIALMAIKSGLHGHGFADFTVRQVWETMTLIPVGMIVGALLGLGRARLKG